MCMCVKILIKSRTSSRSIGRVEDDKLHIQVADAFSMPRFSCAAGVEGTRIYLHTTTPATLSNTDAYNYMFELQATVCTMGRYP